MSNSISDREFEKAFKVGDLIQRGVLRYRITDMHLGHSDFEGDRLDLATVHKKDVREKSSMGPWTLVGPGYQVGDMVTRASWVRDGYEPVKVTAIGETGVLGIREGTTEEKLWPKEKGAVGTNPLILLTDVGPKKAFKFVGKDGTTRGGKYTWPMPSKGGSVVVTCDDHRIVPGQHVCPEQEGDGVMAATTVDAAQSGGHTLRDSVGLWLEYNETDVLGRGHGKIRLRQVTVTGVFDPWTESNITGSPFKKYLTGSVAKF